MILELSHGSFLGLRSDIIQWLVWYGFSFKNAVNDPSNLEELKRFILVQNFKTLIICHLRWLGLD